MVNKTLLSTTTSEIISSRPNRRHSSIDLGEFAGVLTMHTQQSVNPFKDFGRSETAELKSSRKNETQDAAVKKARPDDSHSDRSHENKIQDKNAHSASDSNDVESSRDSQKTESANETQGVDGRENNTTPGASTEAAVNAQSTSDSANNSIDASAGASVESTLHPQQQIEELQQLIQKLTAESPSQQVAVENTDSIKLSAKSIERNNPAMQTNLNLTDQKIIFETGLAEHFVRLLTDQFDQLKNSASKKGESTQVDANASTANVALNSVKAETSQNNLNLTFQQAAPTSTPENQASENMTKIMHIIRSNLGRRQSQLTVQLDPPELGKMRVDVKVIDNNLHLAITTETAEAKQMLSSRMETLRSSLEQSGINLSKFEVVTRSENAAQNQNEQQFQDQSQNGNGAFQQNQQQQNSNAEPNASSQSTSNENVAEPNITLTGNNSSDKTLNLVA